MDKIKSFIHNLSFRASFIFYVVIFAFISLFLILITTYACQKASYKIHAAYSADDGSFYVKIPDGEKGEKVELSAEAVNKLLENMTFTDSDLAKISFLNLIKYLCIPVYSLLCLIVATMLFYRNKMKRPLDILRTAHQRVSDNDLDFTVHYDSKDEMGELVQSFEKMRAALFENNRKMWWQMEQRRQVNISFAHDLRTPLTILKGYSEILQNSDKEEIINMAITMKKHIDRIERYVENMSRLHKMEDITADCKNTDMTDFLKSSSQMASLLCKNAGKHLIFKDNIKSNAALLDKDMIFEVMENLISNAVRYAKNEVCVSIFEENNILTVSVMDDGDGFSPESLNRATQPYYSSEDDRSSHFGLGLYICKILCECHGGNLKIENTQFGAKVTSTFKLGKLLEN